MERAEAKLKVMMDDAMGQMDMVSEMLSDSADGTESAVSVADSGPRSSQPLPPHSNTGVDFGDNSENPIKNNN
jgi:hypothetical protein